MKRRLGLALALGVLLMSGCRSNLAPKLESPSPKRTVAENVFVGSERCASCHAEEHKEWNQSDHHAAMAVPTEKTVLGDFNNSEFEYFGFKSRFFRQDDEYWVETDGTQGISKKFKVEYTFGIKPLQQYLIRFPDGRLQALSICWDSQKKKWFHLFPNEQISSRSPLHWTAPQFNWNFMCAECHSTGVEKNYDAVTDRYDTTFKEINVSCESCHGPGQRHLESPDAKDVPNYGFPVDLKGHGPWSPQTKTHPPSPQHPERNSQQVETCARCHSRHSQLTGAYTFGDPLSQSHSVSVLEEGLYHSDGQIDDEVYVYGSFVQSKMFHAGVVCTDCHNPHTSRLKAKGDNLCLGCHSPQSYDNKAHTHHTQVSCVDCHMPGKLYMGNDFRRDHSLRIPRPDLSKKLGSPNACNQCHQDKEVAWAAKAFKSWYGEGKPHYGETISRGRSGDPRGTQAVADLVFDTTAPDIVRATAVGLSFDLSVLSRALADDSDLVRREAVKVLQQAPPETRQELLLPLVEDPILSVRIEVGRALAGITLDSKAGQKVVGEYRDSLLFNADRTESRLGLAALQAAEGDAEGAEKTYLQALQRDPRSPQVYVNLADFYRTQDRDDEGEGILRKALDTLPKADTAAVHQALGLLLVRKQATPKALKHLKLAAELAPLDSQAGFLHAVALESVGQTKPALIELERIAKQRPYDMEILSALVTFADKAKQPETAAKYRKVLQRLQPK